jgi:hypothetical protein
MIDGPSIGTLHIARLVLMDQLVKWIFGDNACTLPHMSYLGIMVLFLVHLYEDLLIALVLYDEISILWRSTLVIGGLFRVWIASWHTWYHTLGERFSYTLLFHMVPFVWSLFTMVWFSLSFMV